MLAGPVLAPATGLAQEVERTTDAAELERLKAEVRRLAAVVDRLEAGRGRAAGGQEREPTIAALRAEVDRLSERIRRFQSEQEAPARPARTDRTLDEQIDTALSGRGWTPPPKGDRFRFGSYGEIHANLGLGSSPEILDIHRLVLFLGYDFNDWIKLNSEIELEHAFVSEDSGGELGIEQLHLDFILSDSAIVQAGRVLIPLGIVNQKHEPVTFNGVERPLFARYVIPTTWYSDGVGMFGKISNWLKYQAYVVAGLDGSRFGALDGIRDGRLKERPSLNDPAFTARLDAYPFLNNPMPVEQTLRVAASFYGGGVDNGNNGKDPGIDASIAIYSGDFEYSISRFDFRGAIAYERIHNAEEIGNGTASGILGWYLEGALHVWPDAWRRGRLARSDLVTFVRYDWIDTQYQMPSGVARNPDGERSAWTFGFTFFFTPSLVFKADYQIRRSGGDQGLDDLLNLGLGWSF